MYNIFEVEIFYWFVKEIWNVMHVKDSYEQSMFEETTLQLMYVWINNLLKYIKFLNKLIPQLVM